MVSGASTLTGFTIEADDGRVGTVSDFLFDDTTWKIRWLVVDTASWMTGRKVLVHPSATGRVDHRGEALPVRLTRQQMKDSPEILAGQPVSRQMEDELYGHYDWDPSWNGGVHLFDYAYALEDAPAQPHRFGDMAEIAPGWAGREHGDPHLRSIASVTGYHIHAIDGLVGRVQDFVLDETGWTVRYLLVVTESSWPGRHLLMSPYAVQDIGWYDHEVQLDLPCERVQASPSWSPKDPIDTAYEKHLHSFYGWPGYGW